MEFSEIEKLLPNEVVEEFADNLDEFETLRSATFTLIKSYCGLDYEPSMLNEFIDIFLKLVSKRMKFDKDLQSQIERNYTTAIERVSAYRFRDVNISGVVNVLQ